MKTIHKYKLDITDFQNVSMPSLHKVLSAQEQNGEICVWAWVNTETPSVNKIFAVFGTGNPVDIEGWRFIDTVQMPNGLVWHVCEAK